jgi:hypothetical protein
MMSLVARLASGSGVSASLVRLRLEELLSGMTSPTEMSSERISQSFPPLFHLSEKLKSLYGHQSNDTNLFSELLIWSRQAKTWDISLLALVEDLDRLCVQVLNKRIVPAMNTEVYERLQSATEKAGVNN